MAIVVKREVKSVEKIRALYDKDNEKEIIQNIEADKVIVPEIKIDKREVYKDIMLYGVLVILALSGYLLSKLVV